MRTHFALLTALLGIFAAALDAGEIHGVITDADGGIVAGASVTLYSRDSGGERTARTGSRGDYAFTGLAGGTYLLRAGADGFASSETEPITLASGTDLQSNLTLAVAGLRTQVIVTASSTPLMFEEVAKAADLVSSEEMDLRDEVSLAGSLRLLPGFRVKRQGGPGSLTTVRIRGLRQYDTALLIDGLRMRDAADTQGAVTPFWESVTLVAPARAEVLRGSGSSLYGTHAIGGVVNLVSDQGGGSPHGEVLTEGGSLDSLRGLARFSGGAFDNRLLYSGGITHWNVIGGMDGVNPARNTSAQGFLRYALAPSMNWSGRVLASDSFARLTDSPQVSPELLPNIPATGIVQGVPLPDDQVHRVERALPPVAGSATYTPSLNDPDDRATGRFTNAATIFTHQLSPDFTWRASYQLVDSTRTFQSGPAGVFFEPVGFSNRNKYDGRIQSFQLRGDLQAGPHNLFSGGYEFEDEFLDNPNTDENPDISTRANDRARVGQQSHSVFAQDQITALAGRLRVALSGRAQYFRLEEPRFDGGVSPYAGLPVPAPQRALTGDAAVSYLVPSSGTKFRAHLGNSYRAPSLFERYGSSFFFGSFSPFGDPRVAPERAFSVDAGVDQYLFNSSVQLSATYFYTNLQEIILFDFSGLIPPDDPFHRFGGYLNTGGGLARGFESSVRASLPHGAILSAAYTYTDAVDRAPWDGGSVRQSQDVSRHAFSLLVSQWVTRRWNVTFDMFAASDYLVPLSVNFSSRAFQLNGPVKANLVLRYSLPLSDSHTMEFYTKLDNIANRNLYESGFRTPGIQTTVGLRFLF